MTESTETSAKRFVLLTEDREMRVYIAGPMTGLPDFNFPAFNHLAEFMRSAGWHVENPAEHGHVQGAEWADYLRYDIGRLATCECIMLLPGWSRSRGAMLEVHIARQLGMPVMLAEDAEEVSHMRWLSETGAVTDCADRAAFWTRAGVRVEEFIKVTHALHEGQP